MSPRNEVSEMTRRLCALVCVGIIGCGYVDNPNLVDSTDTGDTLADVGSSDGDSTSISTADASTGESATEESTTEDTTEESTTEDTTTGWDPFVFAPDPPENYTRVDRMGMPAVATAVITNKDMYNAANPTDDEMGMFLTEITTNVTGLHGALDDDLLSLIPSLVPCAPVDCLQQAGPLVVPDGLKIDLTIPAGFPNGRALTDQVIDITLAVLLLDLTAMGQTPTTLAEDPLNPPANDAEFLPDFPYLAPPN